MTSEAKEALRRSQAAEPRPDWAALRGAARWYVALGWLGLNVAEIAAVMGVSEVDARRHLYLHGFQRYGAVTLPNELPQVWLELFDDGHNAPPGLLEALRERRKS